MSGIIPIPKRTPEALRSLRRDLGIPSPSERMVDLWESVAATNRDLAMKAIVLQPLNRTISDFPARVEIGERVTVGRTDAADHSVGDDEWVSRLHFSVECGPTHAVLRDLDSTNGTYHNGVRVRKAILFDGDHISAGTSTFIVRFLYRSVD